MPRKRNLGRSTVNTKKLRLLKAMDSSENSETDEKAEE